MMFKKAKYWNKQTVCCRVSMDLDTFQMYSGANTFSLCIHKQIQIGPTFEFNENVPRHRFERSKSM